MIGIILPLVSHKEAGTQVLSNNIVPKQSGGKLAGAEAAAGVVVGAAGCSSFFAGAAFLA